ncbi:hypothetical protein Tco_1039076, partial [Tanacetum coccineum]
VREILLQVETYMPSQKFEDSAEGEDVLTGNFKKLYDDLTAVNKYSMHLPLDVNKEEDDKMWTTAANVAATVGVGGCYGRNVKKQSDDVDAMWLYLRENCVIDESTCSEKISRF